MRRELVFTAYPGRAELARRVTLAEAGLKERSDLQEWIRAHPQILGAGVRMVTYEFDRWVSGAGSHGDRLDLLGLGADGRLVLAELKRDGAPDTVEMQAIKYASYASRFTIETLAACHASYLRLTLGDASVSDEEALAQLDEHCGGLSPEQLAAVRIVLVAGSFPEPVTSSVVWLCAQGLDITLVEVGAYQCATDLVISVSQLWPLPEVDELTVSPVAPASKAAATTTRRRTTTNAVATLAASGAIADGTELRLVPAGSYASEVAQWVAEQPDRGKAVWRAGERVRALEWGVDSARYSASGLAERIVREAAGKETAIVGPEWWALSDGTTLAELAGTSSSGRRDWTPLHQLLHELKHGEWTTYGDLADAIGSHAIAVGQHVARCDDCENAYRVVGSDGRPRSNFAWADPAETRTCREVLEDEGITFSASGSASPADRVSGDQLRARLAALTTTAPSGG
jgi:alkylated DNA nucleotide flippase Atl1